MFGQKMRGKQTVHRRVYRSTQYFLKCHITQGGKSCTAFSPNLISFDRLVMKYKIINKLSPESLWDKFDLRSVHSKYETRNCHDLQIPRLNTERPKSGFKYSALKLWNDLPK